MISQFKFDAFMLSTRPLPINRVRPRARYNLCETTDVVADPRVCTLARRETAIEIYLLTKAWPAVTRRIYVASEFP